MPGAVGELARAGRGLGGGEEGLPDHPGVDRALLERGAGVGRRQERDGDVGVLEAGAFERLDQQVVDVRALVEGDVLALEVGDRLERAVGGDEDRLGPRRRRLVPDIDQRRAGRLGEDRRRLAGGAEVDGADIQPLEELRAGRELRPLDRVALGLQLLLEQPAGLEQDERAVFLEAEADGLVVFGVADRGQRRGKPAGDHQGG